MIQGLVLLSVCSVVLILGAERGAAIRCLVGPIEVTTQPLDAIFTGTITDVRHMRFPGPAKVCSRWPESRSCQAAIATVTVGKTWKGHPAETTTIYSHGGRIDYGRVFKVGKRMLFMLVRDTGETEAEYIPFFCGDTMPEEDARKAGILDELDTLLVSPDPAK